MSKWRENFRWILLGALFISTVFIWYAVIRSDRQGLLTIAMLDVGQGDAIYIEAPNGNQVLIDGGSGRQVLRALGGAMPFYDHSLDVVMATHPDADHIGRVKPPTVHSSHGRRARLHIQR